METTERKPTHHANSVTDLISVLATMPTGSRWSTGNDSTIVVTTESGREIARIAYQQ